MFISTSSVVLCQQLGDVSGRRLIMNDGGTAGTTKNTLTIEPANAATQTTSYALILPGPVPGVNAVLQVASVAGTTATLQWVVAPSIDVNTVFEEVTASQGNVRRRSPFVSLQSTSVGQYAFDAQGSRTLASQSASGSFSGILSGADNTASGQYSSIVGGLASTVSGTHSSILGGRSNTVSGNYSAAFGYGATTSQNNTFIINHPTVGDGTTRVGIDLNDPTLALDVDGGLAIRPPAAQAITADNATLVVGNRSYIVIDPGAVARLGLIVGVGSTAGHILVLRVLGTATGSITIPDVVASNVNLTGDWVAAADDTITLIWSGAQWIEIARSNN